MRTEARIVVTAGTRVLAARLMAVAVVGGLLFGGGLVSVSMGASCPNETHRADASAMLPDCRAFEQVSPRDKGGVAAYPAASPPAQVSASGEALAYLSFQAFPGALGSTALFAAHVSARVGERWQTEEWTPGVPKAEVLKIYKVDYSFSSDLSQAVLGIPLIPLVAGATPNVKNLFLRGSDGTYSLVNSTPPAIPVEAVCGPEELALCWQFLDGSAYAGAPLDFSRVLFESNAQFTENAPGPFVESLYENSGGTVRLVGILPDGEPAAGSTAGAGSNAFYGSSAQEVDRSVERAVSENGLRVIFQAPANGGEPDPEQAGMTEVYVRINGTETIELSAPVPGATPAVGTPEPATFQTASTDGSRVFFTTSAELTTPSNTGEANSSEDLYEYNLETKQLTDLTIDTNPLDATTGAMVQGVVDSSSDGSYVYFVANGQLVEGKGADGQPNLYMVHNGGAPVFIATLSSSGTCFFAGSESADSCVWSPYPATREAYVTPDGRHMAFMSIRSLPTANFPGGYNNTDQETGQADSEVYEYTAPTKSGGTGQLLCASCDPSGAQPVGKALIGGISPTGGIQKGKIGLTGISTPFYRARALSEDGRRLFYAAPASLATPYNSVYEYEQNGVGSCESARGCQNLISSPSSTEADYFLGSSADGNDVFIATSSRLVSSDSDNLRDVYDVRIDGGIDPQVVESQCEAGCHEPSSPPGSSSRATGVIGPSGNALPPSKCKNGFKLSHGKCGKVKKKPNKHKKHRRRDKGKPKATRESRRAR
jgi:hypothetical protein